MARLQARQSGASSNTGNNTDSGDNVTTDDSDRPGLLEPRESGAVSSLDARTAVANAKTTAEKNGALDSPVADTIADLQSQIQSLQSQKNNNQKDNQTTIPGTDQKVSVDGTFSEEDEATVAAAEGEELSPDVRAIIDFRNEQAELQETLLASLNQFNKEQNKLIENEIGLIDASLKQQQKRVQKENERLAQASKVAGIVSGRARYSADEHMGIVSEVIQDGVDRLNSLELEASQQKLEIRKSQREMNFEAFVKGTEILESINEQKYQTFVDVRAQLNAEAERAREQIKFDQEQAERAAELLGPEVAGMSEEKIRQVAEANGIPFGQLLQASQQSRLDELDVESAELGIQKTQLDMQNTRSIMAKRRADMANAAAKTEKAKTIDDPNEFAVTWGWAPPKGMDRDAALSIAASFPMLSNAEKTELAKTWEIEGGEAVQRKADEMKNESEWAPAIDVVKNNKEIKNRFKQAEERMYSGQSPGLSLIQNTFSNQGEKVIGTELFEDAVFLVEGELKNSPQRLTEEEFMNRVADKLLGENGLINRSKGNASPRADLSNRDQSRDRISAPGN